MNSIILVSWIIFTVNFTVFYICDGRPWVAENNAVEESGDFELQPRFIDPITLGILSVVFIVVYIGRKFSGRKQQQMQYPPYPWPPQPYPPQPYPGPPRRLYVSWWA